MSEIVNAQIKSTSFGIEDHGILTCWLILEWPGHGIGFGGYALDQWDEKQDKRVGFAKSIDFLMEIMNVVGVEKWEDLKGKYIRLDVEGLGGRALGIGNLLQDKWLYPKEFFGNE